MFQNTKITSCVSRTYEISLAFVSTSIQAFSKQRTQEFDNNAMLMHISRALLLPWKPPHSRENCLLGRKIFVVFKAASMSLAVVVF